jgi:hypothetical protein
MGFCKLELWWWVSDSSGKNLSEEKEVQWQIAKRVFLCQTLRKPLCEFTIAVIASIVAVVVAACTVVIATITNKYRKLELYRHPSRMNQTP